MAAEALLIALARTTPRFPAWLEVIAAAPAIVARPAVTAIAAPVAGLLIPVNCREAASKVVASAGPVPVVAVAVISRRHRRPVIPARREFVGAKISPGQIQATAIARLTATAVAITAVNLAAVSLAAVNLAAFSLAAFSLAPITIATARFGPVDGTAGPALLMIASWAAGRRRPHGWLIPRADLVLASVPTVIWLTARHSPASLAPAGVRSRLLGWKRGPPCRVPIRRGQGVGPDRAELTQPLLGRKVGEIVRLLAIVPPPAHCYLHTDTAQIARTARTSCALRSGLPANNRMHAKVPQPANCRHHGARQRPGLAFYAV